MTAIMDNCSHLRKHQNALGIAAAVLAGMGLTVSDVVRIALTHP